MAFSSRLLWKIQQYTTIMTSMIIITILTTTTNNRVKYHIFYCVDITYLSVAEGFLILYFVEDPAVYNNNDIDDHHNKTNKNNK